MVFLSPNSGFRVKPEMTAFWWWGAGPHALHGDLSMTAPQSINIDVKGLKSNGMQRII
jgi:hypothetical protein